MITFPFLKVYESIERHLDFNCMIFSCNCKFYHMISSFACQFSERSDFQVIFDGDDPSPHLISAKQKGCLLSHDPFQSQLRQRPDWTFSHKNSRPFLPHTNTTPPASFKIPPPSPKAGFFYRRAPIGSFPQPLETFPLPQIWPATKTKVYENIKYVSKNAIFKKIFSLSYNTYLNLDLIDNCANNGGPGAV